MVSAVGTSGDPCRQRHPVGRRRGRVPSVGRAVERSGSDHAARGGPDSGRSSAMLRHARHYRCPGRQLHPAKRRLAADSRRPARLGPDCLCSRPPSPWGEEGHGQHRRQGDRQIGPHDRPARGGRRETLHRPICGRCRPRAAARPHGLARSLPRVEGQIPVRPARTFRHRGVEPLRLFADRLREPFRRRGHPAGKRRRLRARFF